MCHLQRARYDFKTTACAIESRIIDINKFPDIIYIENNKVKSKIMRMSRRPSQKAQAKQG